ncbi:Radial spoke head protein 9 [Phlyctochytrium planicorne]|nr:Radial spoke head protein 9 [Phlyctochytrium planicorne]
MSFLDIQDMNHFTLAGFVLNTEERTVLATSLRLKAQSEKLSGGIYLWGKIVGINRDYYVAQSPIDNPFSRKFYYSVDMTTWLQLPEVTPEDMDLIEQIRGRFTGDLAYEYSFGEENDGEEKPDGAATETKRTINEERRLAGTIALMNFECEIVPRGAYYRDATHKLSINPMFKGLDQIDLGQLSSYFHFREGFDINMKSLAERAAGFEETIDIFETIAKDEPRGVWTIQAERGGSVAFLRSLLWPGYSFFHAPSPTKWGAFYYGTGVRNVNIGFMLP